jgi:hypothetical protein
MVLEEEEEGGGGRRRFRLAGFEVPTIGNGGGVVVVVVVVVVMVDAVTNGRDVVVDVWTVGIDTTSSSGNTGHNRANFGGGITTNGRTRPYLSRAIVV